MTARPASAQRARPLGIGLRLLLAVLAVSLWGQAAIPTRAADTGVSYSIAASVSRDDEMTVREGIALAERYVAAQLSDVTDEALVVNVRNSDDTTDLGSVAFSGGDYIVVFAGSPGWIRLALFDRIHVIVHEYIHSYQYFVSDGESDALPAWFIEGMADYLAFDAVTRLGLVRARDVHDYHAWAVNQAPDLPSLEELEDRDAFYDEYGPTYSLAYLAIDELLGSREPASLDQFLKGVASGDDWDDAFVDTFDQDPDGFYRSFAAVREGLVAPTRIPEPFEYVAPAKIESRVANLSASGPIEAGGQVIVVARAQAGAICRARLHGSGSEDTVSRSSFADASGRIFWLVTIPEDVIQGTARFAASCGGDGASIEVEITP